ncbi:MAG: hypothetical protein Ct9H300mP29_8160 [Candidatus Neomarinimicrobiota bacterium]|nr:MAG: hypothetical protein Ct9H300mP29_8160 [Candidatus Neomarinimicrobiota bacterium]
MFLDLYSVYRIQIKFLTLMRENFMEKDKVNETESTVDINENNDETKIKRRTVVKGAVAASAVLSMPMILTGIKRAEAASGPVKIGHIEDLSGNIAVYGVQKWHAAQLAVKEINEGKALKGGPVGSGGLGSLGKFAGNAPIMGNGDKDLKFVNKGGLKVAPEWFMLKMMILSSIQEIPEF